MSNYDFEVNPRAWTFTGEIRAVSVRTGWFSSATAYQYVFEKYIRDETPLFIDRGYTLRIGVMMHDGRLSISDPPAGG